MKDMLWKCVNSQCDLREVEKWSSSTQQSSALFLNLLKADKNCSVVITCFSSQVWGP